MFRIMFIVVVFSFAICINNTAQSQPSSATVVKDKSKEKAAQISKRLKLDEEKSKSMYNIVSQANKRIEDLAFGTENYGRLLGYIDEERNEMLKAAITPEQHNEYKAYFGSKDVAEMSKLVSKNKAYVYKEKEKEKKLKEKEAKKKKKEEETKKKEEKKKKDKEKIEAKKAKDKQKKEAQKAKELEKKLAAQKKALSK